LEPWATNSSVKSVKLYFNKLYFNLPN
jgi:hypothetical protein